MVSVLLSQRRANIVRQIAVQVFPVGSLSNVRDVKIIIRATEILVIPAINNSNTFEYVSRKTWARRIPNTGGDVKSLGRKQEWDTCLGEELTSRSIAGANRHWHDSGDVCLTTRRHSTVGNWLWSVGVG